MLRHALIACTLCFTLPLVGCAADPDQDGEEGELPDELQDGKADSLAAPTLLGQLLFQRNGLLGIVPEARNQALDFTLTGEATLNFATFDDQATTIDDSVPVILYLYQRTDRGTWKKLVRAPERNTPIIVQAEAGSYRVIVRGVKTTTSTWARLMAGCDGTGCPDRSCAFGQPGAGLEQLSSAYYRPLSAEGARVAFNVSEIPEGSMEAELLRIAVIYASGGQILAEDTTVAQIAELLEPRISRTVTEDDALSGELFYTFTLKDGGTRSVAFSTAHVTGDLDFNGPKGKAAELNIVAAFGTETDGCFMLPPVCLADISTSTYEPLPEQDRTWSTDNAQQGDAAAGQRLVRALYGFTQAEDVAGVLEGLGTSITESHFRLTLKDVVVPPLHLTTYSFPSGRGSAGGAMVEDDVKAYQWNERKAFGCQLYVPASNQ